MEIEIIGGKAYQKLDDDYVTNLKGSLEKEKDSLIGQKEHIDNEIERIDNELLKLKQNDTSTK